MNFLLNSILHVGVATWILVIFAGVITAKIAPKKVQSLVSVFGVVFLVFKMFIL